MISNRFQAFATAIFCLLVSSSVHAGAVHVVAKTGGAPYAEIQPAIDAASEGDTVLVKAGTYLPFSLSKSLSVVALDNQVTITDGIVVENLPSSARPAILVGLVANGKSAVPASRAGLSVRNNSAPVHIDQCRFRGGNAALINPYKCGLPGDGVMITSSTEVVMTRCQSDGGQTLVVPGWPNPGGLGGHGVRVRNDSVVAVHHSVLKGGRGGNSEGDGGDGGCGFQIDHGQLYAFGSTFVGGRGGDTDSSGPDPAGDGGDGLRMAVGTHAELLGNSMNGGQGGWSIVFGLGADGNPGQPIAAPIGAAHLHAGIAPKLERAAAAYALEDHSALPLRVEGNPGSRVTLWIARVTDFEWIPAWVGVQIPALPALRALDLGVIPASGILNASMYLPESLVPLNASSVFYFQALLTDAANASVLANPWSAVVLDHIP